MREYWVRNIRGEVKATNINEVLAGLAMFKDKVKPNDSIKLVIKGSKALEVLARLPEELRRIEFSLVWAEEVGEEVIAYVVYKTTSPSRFRIREHIH